MDKIKTAVIIAAAGSGSRMKSNKKKQFIEIEGKPILIHTLEKFEAAKSVSAVFISTGKDDVDQCRSIVKKYGLTKIKKIVIGGSERQFSVYNALLEIDKDFDVILVHDAARPFVNPEDIDRVVKCCSTYDGCVLGVKAKDTIKQCGVDEIITSTPNRNCLWYAQTPQGFKRNVIFSAYRQAINENYLATDDAALAEHYGWKIKMLEGSYNNIKITTPDDLNFLSK